MSLVSSDDSAFGDVMMEGDGMDGGEMTPPAPVAPPPAYRKQGFSIYSVMLILSFVFLATAAIMFYIEAGKY